MCQVIRLADYHCRLFAALTREGRRVLSFPQGNGIDEGRVDLCDELLSFYCTGRMKRGDCMVTYRVSRRSCTRRSRSSCGAQVLCQFHLICLGAASLRVTFAVADSESIATVWVKIKSHDVYGEACYCEKEGV